MNVPANDIFMSSLVLLRVARCGQPNTHHTEKHQFAALPAQKDFQGTLTKGKGHIVHMYMSAYLY